MSTLCHGRWLLPLHGLLALAMVMAAPTATAAAPTGAHAPHDVIRGTFTQRKYLAELAQPLVSSGTYVLAARHGLIWQIRQPVQVEVVISRKQLIQRSDGHQIAHIDAEQQPALQIVAAILLAVFQADTEQLDKYFKVQKQTLADGDWRLTLTPATAAVSEFIQRIRVHGAAYIERIEIRQPGGDHSVIELQPDTTGPDTLSAGEQAQFNH